MCMVVEGGRVGWNNSFVQIELLGASPMSSFLKWKKWKPRGAHSFFRARCIFTGGWLYGSGNAPEHD